MTLPASTTTRPIAALLLALLAAPCLAQTSDAPLAEPFFSGTMPPDPELAGVVRLTPEQREAAIEAGAVHSARAIDGNGAPDHKIHGEVGVEVGTGGARAVFGSAVVPLGDSAVAAFSFESDARNYRWRRR